MVTVWLVPKADVTLCGTSQPSCLVALGSWGSVRPGKPGRMQKNENLLTVRESQGRGRKHLSPSHSLRLPWIPLRYPTLKARIMNNFSVSHYKIKCEILGTLTSLNLYTPWCCLRALKAGHLGLDLKSPGVGQTLPSRSWKCSPVAEQGEDVSLCLCFSSYAQVSPPCGVCVHKRRYWWARVLEAQQMVI